MYEGRTGCFFLNLNVSLTYYHILKIAVLQVSYPPPHGYDNGVREGSRCSDNNLNFSFRLISC